MTTLYDVKQTLPAGFWFIGNGSFGHGDMDIRTLTGTASVVSVLFHCFTFSQTLETQIWTVWVWLLRQSNLRKVRFFGVNLRWTETGASRLFVRRMLALALDVQRSYNPSLELEYAGAAGTTDGLADYIKMGVKQVPRAYGMSAAPANGERYIYQASCLPLTKATLRQPPLTHINMYPFSERVQSNILDMMETSGLGASPIQDFPEKIAARTRGGPGTRHFTLFHQVLCLNSLAILLREAARWRLLVSHNHVQPAPTPLPLPPPLSQIICQYLGPENPLVLLSYPHNTLPRNKTLFTASESEIWEVARDAQQIKGMVDLEVAKLPLTLVNFDDLVRRHESHGSTTAKRTAAAPTQKKSKKQKR